MTVSLQTRLRSAVELLQRTLAVLGFAVDILDVSGAGRVATAFQVLALFLTLVLVVLMLVGRFAGRTFLSGVLLVLQTVVRQFFTVAAMLAGAGMLSLNQWIYETGVVCADSSK